VRFYTLVVLQLAICVLSVFQLAFLGKWIEGSPWIYLVPGLFLIVWGVITRQVILATQHKVWVILLCVIEVPIAAAWPVWILAFILGETTRSTAR
jgi:hypothetical protein